MSGRAIPAIAIVGAGRLGRALALSLALARCPSVALVARSGRSRRQAEAFFAAAWRPGSGRPRVPEVTTDLDRAVGGSRWILLAVPDRAIGEVASDLAGRAIGGWTRRVVLHHAGALGPAPLAPLAGRGAAVGVLHPLEAFAGAAEGAAGAFRAGRARIEGDRKATRAAEELAALLGLRPLRLRARWSDDDRALYHAAASLVANDLLALISLGSELLVALGSRRGDAVDALAHLAATSAWNVRGGASIAAALTGPAARGDVETVARHVRALSRRSRAAAEAYRILSSRLVTIAERAGRLDRGSAASIRRLLSGGRPRKRTV